VSSSGKPVAPTTNSSGTGRGELWMHYLTKSKPGRYRSRGSKSTKRGWIRAQTNGSVKGQRGLRHSAGQVQGSSARCGRSVVLNFIRGRRKGARARRAKETRKSSNCGGIRRREAPGTRRVRHSRSKSGSARKTPLGKRDGNSLFKEIRGRWGEDIASGGGRRVNGGDEGRKEKK